MPPNNQPKPIPAIVPGSLLDRFVDDVKMMRHFQKLFFRAERGSAGKEEALRRSREMEGIVDAHLKLLRNAQQQSQDGLDL